MKRMLFNATQAEELRVAIVDGQTLLDFDIETFTQEIKKGNIYKGIITRIEPSLEACFIDYGTDRQGFLPFKEISPSFYKAKEYDRSIKPKIQDVLKEGMKILVQVEKDERGNKGAALTTYIGLAGRYLVLMPNNPRGGGISRRIDGEERLELKEILSNLKIPRGMSVIARTAGIGRTVEDLEWDLNYLIQLWKAVLEAYNKVDVQNLLLQESALVIRSIRDYFQPDISEILIDNEKVYNKIYQFVSLVMPNNLNRVKLYKDNKPLFVRFHIEDQIESAYNRVVELENGGSIVIDHTEALVSIDVNSSKSTKGSDVEETAFKTNLDAVKEITRQIRLRDLGGLIVIDFIDMLNVKNQREIENTLKEYLKKDRARVQMSKISKFGLLELSRQRLQVSLGESSHIMCPRCNGTGFIRGVQSISFQVLRLIQQQSEHATTVSVQAQLPVEVATFLLNEKREEISNLESISGKPIVLIPNLNLETPNFEIIKITSDNLNQINTPSYERIKNPQEELSYIKGINGAKNNIKNNAAVNIINHIQQAPDKIIKKSLLKLFFTWIKDLRVFNKKEQKINDYKNNSSFNQQNSNFTYKSNKKNINQKKYLKFENKKKSLLNDNKDISNKINSSNKSNSNVKINNVQNNIYNKQSDNATFINNKANFYKNNLNNIKSGVEVTSNNLTKDIKLDYNKKITEISVEKITEDISATVVKIFNQNNDLFELQNELKQEINSFKNNRKNLDKKNIFNSIENNLILVETNKNNKLEIDYEVQNKSNKIRRLDKNNNLGNIDVPTSAEMEQVITKQVK